MSDQVNVALDQAEEVQFEEVNEAPAGESKPNISEEDVKGLTDQLQNANRTVVSSISNMAATIVLGSLSEEIRLKVVDGLLVSIKNYLLNTAKFENEAILKVYDHNLNMILTEVKQALLGPHALTIENLVKTSEMADEMRAQLNAAEAVVAAEAGVAAEAEVQSE